MLFNSVEKADDKNMLNCFYVSMRVAIIITNSFKEIITHFLYQVLFAFPISKVLAQINYIFICLKHI